MIMANIYPPWWDTTLTVYNKYTDPVTDVISWYRHKVEKAFWKYTGNKVVINENVIESNDIICRIRKDDAFLENYQWIESDEKSEHFTLSKGDIIVKGEVTDEIDEYLKGQHSSDLIRKYKNLQGCLVVSEFTINTDGGRCNEHYYVKGE